MDSDEVSQGHEHTKLAWLNRLAQYGTLGVETLASKYHNGDKCACISVDHGSFNYCFKIIFDDGTAWAVRFPIAGDVMYPEEKVRREVAVMRFLKENTRVPVPTVIAFGMAIDNHDPEIGPFIIAEWIEGPLLSSIMEELPRPSWGPVLRKDISDDTLYIIYRQMARILLELSMHDFDKIGALSLVKDENGTTSWQVTSAPLTLKLNEIERGGYVQLRGKISSCWISDLANCSDHLSEPFQTVTAYFQSLVQQSIKHLREQKNSVDNADDARNKYVHRQRIQSIAPRFVSKKHNHGPYKLICDDMRPGNMKINLETSEIIGMLDVEWTYTGPYQFLYSPPSWLILSNPTSWTSSSEGLYQQKFLIFIKSLEKEEVEREIETGDKVQPDEKLSYLMRQSMQDGKFWFNELLRESFNFDEEVLWPNIKRFIQHPQLQELEIPNDADVEAFVQTKMEDLHQYKIQWQALEEKKKGMQN